MSKTFKIKKLSITLSLRFRRFVEFVFIKITYDRFMDYNLVFVFCNIALRISYENTKQREALERIHKAFAEMGID